MKFNGKVKFDQPADTIWEALHDTEVVKNAVPGCEGISLEDNGEHQVHLDVAIGAIKGSYTCNIKWEDVNAPHHFFIIAKRWNATAKIDCKLIASNEDTCQLAWNCEAEVSGKIAKIGSTILGGVAKHMANSFFKRIDKQLQVEKELQLVE